MKQVSPVCGRQQRGLQASLLFSHSGNDVSSFVLLQGWPELIGDHAGGNDCPFPHIPGVHHGQ